MKKIALITDTASDLPKQWQEKYDVYVLHFQIVYQERSYKDQVEITSREVLRDIEDEKPTTSLPSLEEMYQVFDDIQAKGYDKVLGITISSGLSGCYNALRMVAEEYTELETVIYDSKTISIGESTLVREAGEMIHKGYDMKEIVKRLDEVRKGQHIFFVVDTLKYLISGGRIGRVSGLLGGVLNLKPIIKVADDGVYTTHSKVRGSAKALSKIVEEAENIIHKASCEVYLIHGDGQMQCNQIHEALKKNNDNTPVHMMDWISPVACVHTGPGFVGMLVQEV